MSKAAAKLDALLASAERAARALAGTDAGEDAEAVMQFILDLRRRSDARRRPAHRS